MSKSLTIKKFAKGGLTALLAPIVVSVAFSVFLPICVVLTLFLFAPVFAYKIFASLHRTQKLPRLQVNKEFPPIPFEFVDTDKSISKPAKVFLSVGVLFAFMILSPCILLYEIAVGFYASLRASREVFEKLKEVIYGSTEIDNSAMQSEGKEKRSLDSSMFSENFVDLAKERVPELFEECRNVVTHIKAKYSDSELEKSGIERDIDEIDKVQRVYFEKRPNGDFSFNKDVNLDVFGASLKKVVSFVESSGERFDLSFERPYVIKSCASVSAFLRFCESLRTEEDKLSAEPSKKLDNANQSPAVGVSWSSILK